WMHRERSQLNIFESTLGDVLLRFSQQRGQVVFVVNKRSAMIGKRKRDHAPPSKTAMHFAKWNAGHNAVFGIRQDARNGNEVVGPAKRFKPFGRVKDARRRVRVDELPPAAVGNWIDPEDRHGAVTQQPDRTPRAFRWMKRRRPASPIRMSVSECECSA